MRGACGCPSLTALRRWFGWSFDAFRRHGGSVGIYAVPENAIAEQDAFQVVYRQDLARRLLRLSCYG